MDKNNNIEKLLELATDIEALLLLASNKGDDTPQHVWNKIKLKAEELHNLLGANDKALYNNPEESSLIQEATDDNADSEDGNSDIVNVAVPIEVEMVDIPEPQRGENDSDIIEQKQTVDENINECVEEIISQDKEVLRVDELLQLHTSKDIKKAFTLNDKFRFCRELFGNCEARFIDTIDLLSAMPTIEEALEYLYIDMGWDSDNDDVKDFVVIITNHFNAK